MSGPTPQDASCVWSFDDGNGPSQQTTAPCDQEVKLRVPSGRTTVATVDIPLGDGTAQRVSTEIAVRDVLVAGLGDSIAAGEGNPDKAVELDGGFCFKRFLSGGGSQYFRPSRAGYDDDRSCENGPSSPAAASDWARHGARWMNPACHRSLYSYQVRTTLALAIEQPHLAVTLVPLACTGATIGAGMFAGQRADDCPWVVGIETCSGTSPAQFDELKDVMAAVHRQDPKRNLDHGSVDGRRQRREFRRACRQRHCRRDDGAASAQDRAAPSSASPTRKNPWTGFARTSSRNCVRR